MENTHFDPVSQHFAIWCVVSLWIHELSVFRFEEWLFWRCLYSHLYVFIVTTFVELSERIGK
jgi:hypothetical protein